MKVSKLLLAASLLCVAMLTVLAPAFSAVAQDNPTPTPAPIVTATGPAPSGGGSGDETPVPREIQALRAARALLSKKLGKRITYVKAWSWELLLFKDSALGCPADGQAAKPGDTAGYRITITDFDNKEYELHVTFDLSGVFMCAAVGSAATTGGSPLPAPVGGKATSGAFEAGGHIQDFNGGTVDKMRSAGMKWVKVQLAYGDGRGPSIISAAKNQGFKTLLAVVGDKAQVLNPGYFDQFAAFVGGLASSGADGIEVWNEMNIDREWPTGQINPASYVPLLTKAYNAIKAANGNTIVISGALSPTGAEGAFGLSRVWNDDRYYAGMASAGVGRVADCIGVHYNEGIVSPLQTSGDPRGDNYPTRYFSTMLNRAIGPFPGKAACYTELGYLSPEGYGPLPGGFAWARNVTVANQAQWLAQAAQRAQASGRVRLMIVFNVDFAVYGEDPQAGYAIIRQGGGCPACSQLAAVVP